MSGNEVPLIRRLNSQAQQAGSINMHLVSSQYDRVQKRNHLSGLQLIAGGVADERPIFIYQGPMNAMFWKAYFTMSGAMFPHPTLNARDSEVAMIFILTAPFENTGRIIDKVVEISKMQLTHTHVRLDAHGSFVTVDPNSIHEATLARLQDAGEQTLASGFLFDAVWNLQQQCPTGHASSRALMAHILGLAAKAISNPSAAKRASTRHNTLYYAKGVITGDLELSEQGAEALISILKSSCLVRYVIVVLILAANASPASGDELGGIIRHHSIYINDNQLYQYNLVCRNIIATNNPVAALALVISETKTICKLLDMQEAYGVLGPYIKFLELPGHGEYAGNSFQLLFSIAKGMEDVRNNNSTGYNKNINHLCRIMYKLGREIATEAYTKLDETGARIFGYDAEAIAATNALLQRAAMAVADGQADTTGGMI